MIAKIELTNARPEYTAGEWRSHGVLLNQLLGGSLGVGEDVGPFAQEHLQGVVGQTARGEVGLNHVVDGLEIGRRSVKLLLDNPLRTVGVGRGHEHKALEFLALATEFQHALGTKNVRSQGHAYLLV